MPERTAVDGKATLDAAAGRERKEGRKEGRKHHEWGLFISCALLVLDGRITKEILELDSWIFADVNLEQTFWNSVFNSMGYMKNIYPKPEERWRLCNSYMRLCNSMLSKYISINTIRLFLMFFLQWNNCYKVLKIALLYTCFPITKSVFFLKSPLW